MLIMTTITIPHKLEKEKDLVVITRKQYERFLKFEKKRVGPTDPILLAAEKAEADFRAGRTSGPFNSVAEFEKFMHARARSRKS